MELSKNKISLYSSLSSKKMRQKHRLFTAEGEKCVFDMLDSFSLDSLIVTEEWHRSNVRNQRQNIGPIYTVTSTVMKKISALTTPSDVVAVFHMPDDTPVERIDNNKLYLLLDGVQDPGNMGTIIRTADWFGVDTIFVSHDSVDIFNPKTVQSTMGSLSRVKVRYADLEKLISSNRDIPVYGMLLEGKNIYTRTDLTENGFIIMGNEGNGISAGLRAMIDNPLLIPPYNAGNHAESLNVAIATAVTLSWFRGRKAALTH